MGILASARKFILFPPAAALTQAPSLLPQALPSLLQRELCLQHQRLLLHQTGWHILCKLQFQNAKCPHALAHEVS